MTEQIYVHSKLIIADDNSKQHQTQLLSSELTKIQKGVLIGSANLNDRSLLGNRDSEIAVLIEDSNQIEGRMNGSVVSVSHFGHSLRTRLWKEHLGLPAESTLVDDPVHPSTWHDLWLRTSHLNTEIYDALLSIPKNSVQTWEQLWDDQFEHVDPKPDETLEQLRGHLVDYPIDFLKLEELRQPLFWRRKQVTNIFT
jgi:phospholipase D1/2